MKKTIGLLVVLLSLTSCIKKPVEGVRVVDVAAYEAQLKEPNVQLIDVRTPAEYAEGHIENSKNINITGEDFDQQVASLDKSKPVMLYCKSGMRSAKASLRLKELGFENITDLEGGFGSWKSANKPIEE
ncbi:rhodanese-like domain-containing protein [Flavobacterium ardleyense]|uniref:Rhodanese-like domain-containing protein n=1 Tax=Flavobacterium ardleyense TaxID=2038737 RepID=A0ABW5ZBW3_9FLAO